MAVERWTADDLFPMHELPRAEVNCQLIRDSYWTRGFLDAWAIELDGEPWGAEPSGIDTSRDESSSSLPGYRAKAVELFAELLPALMCSCVEAK